MIYTVTLNPCIDKTLILDSFQEGALNRVSNVMEDYCGKGINVSVALSVLGIPTAVTGLIPSSHGPEFFKKFEKYGIKNGFIWVAGTVRTNLKLINLEKGTTTEINEKGLVSYIPEAVSEFLSYVKEIPDCDIIVISGSAPKDFDFEDYKKLINICKKKNFKIFADVQGKFLSYAAENGVFLIKPNIYEFEELTMQKYNSLEEIKEALVKYVKDKNINVLLSLGEKGAFFANKKEIYFKEAHNVKVESTTGAGDAMLAGYIYGYINGKTNNQCLDLAVNAASATIMTEGTKPMKLADFKKLDKQ